MLSAPSLEFPQPADFVRKKVEAAQTKKEDRAGPRQKRGNTVSLTEGNGETGKDKKAEEDEDTAENCRGHISPGIGHAEGDSEQTEKRASQRISQPIPMFRFIGGTEAIV